ncbi:hypothetical protein ACRZ5S_22890 (plasmid) [Vibrio scophthalmi]|uniref:hypothetical protein n=1 Tax=Vibrio scophthalmi TaxID=45658 RepID=UPI003EC072AF
MTDNQHYQSSSSLWAKFYRAEEAFYDFVTTQAKEVESFGQACYPTITSLLDAESKTVTYRPKHIRWIGSLEGNLKLMKEIQIRATEVRDLYLMANPKAQRYPREIILLPDCWKLVVNKNAAFSSHIVRNVERLVMASECVKTELYDLQLSEYHKLLASLSHNGFKSAEIHLNPATISITVKSEDIIQHFKRDDLVYRVPSGIQYRMRVNEGMSSYQSKLGFVICLNTPTIGQPSSYRKGRGDKYSIVSEPLMFPGDIKGQFWIQKY